MRINKLLPVTDVNMWIGLALLIAVLITIFIVANQSVAATTITQNHSMSVDVNGTASFVIDGANYTLTNETRRINFSSNFTYEPVIINVTNTTLTVNLSNASTVITINQTLQVTVQNVTFNYDELIRTAQNASIKAICPDNSENLTKGIKEFINDKVVPRQIDVQTAQQQLTECVTKNGDMNISLIQTRSELSNFKDFFEREKRDKNTITIIAFTTMAVLVLVILMITQKPILGTWIK